jgi:hypothetical protein
LLKDLKERQRWIEIAFSRCGKSFLY